jgi:hypothetical protein
MRRRTLMLAAPAIARAEKTATQRYGDSRLTQIRMTMPPMSPPLIVFVTSRPHRKANGEFNVPR